MKNFTLLACVSAMVITACAEKPTLSPATTTDKMDTADLSQYKWKNRIIISYPADEISAKDQDKLIAENKEEFDDRDLIIIRVDKELENYSEKARLAIIEKYQLKPGTHTLLGKDGGAKSKQSGMLDLDKFFRLIDSMPMRQQEMKSDD